MILYGGDAGERAAGWGPGGLPDHGTRTRANV